MFRMNYGNEHQRKRYKSDQYRIFSLLQKGRLNHPSKTIVSITSFLLFQKQVKNKLSLITCIFVKILSNDEQKGKFPIEILCFSYSSSRPISFFRSPLDCVKNRTQDKIVQFDFWRFPFNRRPQSME